MKRFVMLLRLEIKKYRKGFPGLLLSAAILCLIVFGMALMGQQLISGVGSITQENGQEQKKDSKSFKTKISAAIVIEDESKAMKLAAMMLDKMDSVNTILDIDYVSAKEGKHLLEENKVAVLIRIPENTVKSIMNGENQPIEIEFPENSGYEAAVFKECADAAVQLLASAQAGIYTIYDFYKEYGIYNKKDRTIHPQNQTNKPPKPFTQATSTHIRSPSHNPHQHTSEAHLSSHISIHPKLFSQATSAHIRSSSLKSHKTVTKTPDINQPVNQSTSTNQANHLFP